MARSNKPTPLIRINRLYATCLDLVEREVAHLVNLAIVQKLSQSAAKDLRDYVKLLSEMKKATEAITQDKRDRRNKYAAGLTEAELEKAVRAHISRPVGPIEANTTTTDE